MTKVGKEVAKKPVTKAKYDEACERYGTNAKASKKIVDASEAKIAEETKKRHEKLGNMPKEMEADFAIIQQYCEENKEKMFGEAQSLEFKHGSLIFRKGNWAVIADKQQEEALLAALKKKGMTVYYGTKESLDKKKIISDREDKKLIKVLEAAEVVVDQGETFSIAIN